jgi:hypothetical protein
MHKGCEISQGKCTTEIVTPLFQCLVWQRPILNSHWKIRPCIKSHLVSYAMRSELGKKSSEEQIGELGIGGGQIVLGALLYSFLFPGGQPAGTASQWTARHGRVSLAIRRTGPDGCGVALHCCLLESALGDHGWGSRPGLGRIGPCVGQRTELMRLFFSFAGPNLLSTKNLSGQILD